MDFDQAFEVYSHQLRFGCGLKTCTCPHCRSSRNFMHVFENADDIDIDAIELAEKCDDSNVCKNLPYFVKDMESKEVARKFNELIISHDPEKLLDDNEICTFFATLENKEAFAYLLVPEDKFPNVSDLCFSEELSLKLVDIIKKNNELINYADDLINNILSFNYNTRINTITSIRTFFVSLLFYPIFIPDDCFNNPSCNRYAFVNQLNLEATKMWVTTLNQYHFFIPMIPHILYSIIDHIMNIKILENPHPPEFHPILHVINSVAEINEKYKYCERSVFVNPRIMAMVKPAAEFDLFLKGINGMQLFNRLAFLNMPMILSFDVKREILDVEALFLNSKTGPVTIKFNRNNAYEEAMANFTTKIKSGNRFSKLSIGFKGEQSQDDGGVSREFFHIIFNHVIDPKVGLFIPIPGECYYINPAANVPYNTWYFIGITLGLALFNRVMIPIKFPDVFYLLMRQQPIKVRDLEEIDPELFQRLLLYKKQIKNKEINIADADIYFTATTKGKDGVMKDVPLVPYGNKKLLTNSNIDEYIEAMSRFKILEEVRDAILPLQKGFSMFFTKVLDTFPPDEISLLISGKKVVNWQELEETSYYLGYNVDDVTPKLFWKVFWSLSDKDKEKLLFFVTSSNKVPATGIKSLRFTIQKGTVKELLPVAHTCTSTLILPPYTTLEEMERAIKICCENCVGFGVL